MIKKMKGQCALLVPIEVLAFQHYNHLVRILHPLGIQVRLLTGSVPASHAIVQQDVDFRNLKFVIIDEQHKFGVKQRSFFKNF